MTPELSIIICSRNRADKLEHCLNAIEESIDSKTNFELVLLNNASNDSTTSVMERALEKLPGAYGASEEERPRSLLWNKAIEVSRGELLLFLADNAYPDQACIKEHLNAHKERHEHAVVGQFLFSWQYRKRIMHIALCERNLFFRTSKLHNESHNDPSTGECPYYCFTTNNMSIKRSTITNSKISFDESFQNQSFEDIEFAYRLTRNKIKLTYNDRARVFYDELVDIDSLRRHVVQEAKSILELIQKHPELTKDFLGSETIDSTLRAEWQEFIETNQQQYKTCIEEITAVQHEFARVANQELENKTKQLTEALGEALSLVTQYEQYTTFCKFSPSSPGPSPGGTLQY